MRKWTRIKDLECFRFVKALRFSIQPLTSIKKKATDKNKRVKGH